MSRKKHGMEEMHQALSRILSAFLSIFSCKRKVRSRGGQNFTVTKGS
jgi:hypothetical protein